MKSNLKIKLAVPTINLVECRKFKGGYYELWGGVLDPAVCVADGPDDEYPDADDGWLPDYKFGNPEDYYEGQYDTSDDGQHDSENPDNKDNSESNNGESVSKQFDVDSVVTPEIATELIKDTGLNIIIDQNFLNEKSNGYEAMGGLVFAGQTLPNGEIAEVNTIILGENATVAAVLEEMFHSWQGQTLYTGSGSPSEAISAMEFMNESFEYIYKLLIDDANNTSELPSEFMEELLGYIIYDEETHSIPIGFDWESFYNNWDDGYFDDWLKEHEGHPYGKGDDSDWVWDWESAKEWWDEYYGW